MKKALKTIARGDAFPYAGQRWIALEHDPLGRTLCLAESIVEDRAFDENNRNNWGLSSSRDYLNGPFLDNLIDKAGSGEAFLETELDLTTDDGLKDYGTCKATIFLLTVDQYRRNRDVIANADDWWWLSTAFSTAANGYESRARLVRTGGALSWSSAYYGSYGLRPACYLDSELLISIDGEVTTEELAEGAQRLAAEWAAAGCTLDQVVAGLNAYCKMLREEAPHE